MNSKKQSIFSHFKSDVVSGLIVFLIALPLCLGIAQAAHAPLFSGIVAGALGGIVVGLLSKSQLSVSGPTASLVTIIIASIQQLGAFDLFLCTVIVAGVVQLILGFLRAGAITSYFPTSVIEGVLAGIGLTIILKQLPDAVGFLQTHPSAGIEDAEGGVELGFIAHILEHIELGAVIITVIGITILALWQTKGFKKIAIVPAGLLVVVIGTMLNQFFGSSSFALDKNYLVQLPVPGSINDFLGQFAFPDLKGFTNPQVWQAGIVIALISSLETLLSIEATDKLDPYKRYTSGDAELKAQGIGNIISGFLGGLPITSVIVRSSTNINAGARSKLSTIIHGTLLLICVATIPFILNMIPKAALAAILIFTGYKLCRPSMFKRMWHSGFTQFIPFVVTVILVVLPMFGLLKGVAIGVVISIIFMLRENMNIPYYYHRSRYSNNDLIKITLAQEVSFLNKASIKKTLQAIPDNANIIIDASKTEYIDFDVLDIIRDFQISQAPSKGINVSLEGFKNIYKVPSSVSQEEIIAQLMDTEEVPERSAGDHRKLIKHLQNQ